MQPVLLFLSILQVVPIGMEGHSAAGGDHDYGTNSLLWHLVFVMLWVGGLMALIAHGRRLGPNLAFAVKRYSGIAFMAIVVLAVSGLINTLIRMNISDLVDSAYGIILITKFVLTILLGIFGLAHRAHHPAAGQGSAPFYPYRHCGSSGYGRHHWRGHYAGAHRAPSAARSEPQLDADFDGL